MKKTCIFFAVFLLAFAAAAAFSADEERGGAYVDAVTLARADEGELRVSFKVRDIGGERLHDILDSGLPVKFTYSVRLVRLDKAIWEGDAVRQTFERVLENDNLKNRFITTIDGKKLDFAELSEALNVMGTVDDFTVCSLSMLSPKGKYQTEIQLRYAEFKLPFALHRLLPFLSKWDEKTPWKVVKVPRELYR